MEKKNVIVIGASAGGPDVLKRLFSGLSNGDDHIDASDNPHVPVHCLAGMKDRLPPMRIDHARLPTASRRRE